ncbi:MULTISPECIES: ribosome maturation factor RimM [Jonquetella]|uniref:Ribosome maturation factor RimM n=1 Tax=Jonquetella anthropi DSM 22815 TaxID=885272 RepID=H0UK32_9BACT|nr:MULTISPECIES: ribosome maturation factor RimM [Jonquetella]EHM13042.1 16S rRNA processing protein RimM [Jonquetella anthropi DSM 22815]ERL23785.1 16S rRNA processing protein RimM [Jonquetella sp. BV3C21]
MEDRVVIAKVVGPHGVKGAVRVAPLTDFPERFETMTRVRFYRDGEEVGQYPLKSVGELRSKGQIILELGGLSDAAEAEALRGCFICVPPDEMVPLPEGQYWIRDLVGLQAKDETGEVLGVVRDVLTTGASDIFEIEGLDGKKHLVPFVDQFIRQVSLDRRELVISMMEGLWD